MIAPTIISQRQEDMEYAKPLLLAPVQVQAVEFMVDNNACKSSTAQYCEDEVRI